MVISTTDKCVKVEFNKGVFTYPLGSISYTVDEGATSLTLFRNHEAIGTAPLGMVSVNGSQLTVESLDSLLDVLFKSGNGGGVSLPIEVAGVNGLLDSLDGKVDKETGKGLSEENYSTIEKNKLANLDNTKDIDKPVSKAQLLAINKAVADIEIGGRNYLPSSHYSSLNYFDSATRQWYIPRFEGEQPIIIKTVIIPEDGTYTIQAKVNKTAISAGVRVVINGATAAYLGRANSSGGIFKTYSYTWGLKKGDSLSVQVYTHNFTDETESLLVKDVKLEKGTKATDWTPAIEDCYTFSANLLDFNPSLWEQGAINTSVVGKTDTLLGNTKRIRAKVFTRVEPNTDFQISALDPNFNIVVKEYDQNKCFIQEPVAWNNVSGFRTSDQTRYLRYLIKKADDSTIRISDLDLNIISLKERLR